MAKKPKKNRFTLLQMSIFLQGVKIFLVFGYFLQAGTITRERSPGTGRACYLYSPRAILQTIGVCNSRACCYSCFFVVTLPPVTITRDGLQDYRPAGPERSPGPGTIAGTIADRAGRQRAGTIGRRSPHREFLDPA